MKGCMTCLKYSFFFFNFLFWALGALALGVGIWGATDAGFETAIQEIRDLDVSALKQAAYLMIVAGAIMMVIAFFGCLGAVRGSQFLLAIFFFLLLLVFAIFVAVLVIVFVAPHLTDNVTKPIFLQMVESYTSNNNNNNSSSSGSSGSLDLIQKTLKCCGADGSKDFTDKQIQIPESCYTDGKVNTEGCVHALHDQLKASFADYPAETGAITAIVMALNVVGMVLSLTICCAIRREGADDEFKVV